MNCPSVGWLPFLKMLFGILLLLIVASLSGAIALGKVEEKTSYGLGMLLGCFTTMAGGFAQWAFSAEKDVAK